MNFRTIGKGCMGYASTFKFGLLADSMSSFFLRSMSSGDTLAYIKET